MQVDFQFIQDLPVPKEVLVILVVAGWVLLVLAEAWVLRTASVNIMMNDY